MNKLTAEAFEEALAAEEAGQPFADRLMDAMIDDANDGARHTWFADGETVSRIVEMPDGTLRFRYDVAGEPFGNFTQLCEVGQPWQAEFASILAQNGLTLGSYNDKRGVGDCIASKMMFAVTHSEDGDKRFRRLTFPNQGRNHHDTRDKAEERLALVAPELRGRILTDAEADTLAVEPFICYAHGDVMPGEHAEWQDLLKANGKIECEEI